MTTRQQDNDFLGDVIGSGLLDTAIEWIRKNLEPEEVFDDSDLDKWASNQGYTKET